MAVTSHTDSQTYNKTGAPADDAICANCSQPYYDHAAHGSWCPAGNEDQLFSSTKRFTPGIHPLLAEAIEPILKDKIDPPPTASEFDRFLSGDRPDEYDHDREAEGQ